MHESTSARDHNKYVHTPQGVFELKYFFNSAIQCLDGESVFFRDGQGAPQEHHQI